MRIRTQAVAALAAVAVMGCTTANSDDSIESVRLQASGISFRSASPYVLIVDFNILNTKSNPLRDVTCSISAYVAGVAVSEFLSGGSLDMVPAASLHQATASIEIKDAQADFVDHVEVKCST